ncbi:MAG: alpha/beta hydrolase [Opitutales bacterium]|nr:alpha/beta hydrolase [Opitutales bacterium]
MKKNILNSQGENIDYIFHEGTRRNFYLLIIGHGIAADMDEPIIQKLAEKVAEQGMSVLRFSFSGNGDSDGRFDQCTITKEVEDLQSVLSAVAEGGWRPIYAGHSMGATVGALTAAVDSRIELLISLAGIVNTKNFFESEFAMLTPGKDNMWDEESCPLSREFVDDITQIESVLPLVSRVELPWLLVHGTRDKVISSKESQSLVTNFEETRELVEIEGADHLFSGDALELATESVIDWLGKKLQSN